MQTVQELLAGLRLGSAQVHHNLAIFPLLALGQGGGNESADYMLLGEALEKKLARVTEVSGQGSAANLTFENDSSEQVLLIDGDELIGAKQNRVINISILVGGGKRIVIPVSCVEQGRWRYHSPDFYHSGRSYFNSGRARMAEQVSRSLRSSGYRHSDQGNVWSSVSEKIRSTGTDSPTESMSDAYESSELLLDSYTKAFRAEPRQCGALAFIDGRVVGLEYYDCASTFAKCLDKLVRGYAFDAIETNTGTAPFSPVEEEAKRFLERIGAAAKESFAALGEGEDIRISGKGLVGSALVANGRIVHMAGFEIST
ncbi:MAG: DUF6569 family protein [Burkholderiaceae bacterium]